MTFYLIGVFLCLCVFFWMCCTNIKAKIFHIVTFISMFAPVWNVVYGVVAVASILITYMVYRCDPDECFDFVDELQIIHCKPFYKFMLGMKFDEDDKDE